MVPGLACAAACIASALACTKSAPWVAPSAPVATSAVYSPRLCPATAPRSSRTWGPRRRVMTASSATRLIVYTASWALRVAWSSSASAWRRSAARSRPSASLKRSTRAHEGWSRQPAPMPGRCEPWPGKSSASMVTYAIGEPLSTSRAPLTKEPLAATGQPDLGIYVHVPFCRRRCDYCAFATWTDRHHLWERYVAACRAELRTVATGRQGPATSVFFGGGTPSLLPAELLLAVLSDVAMSPGLAPGAEVTVECNPETVTADLLAAYRAGGVTRLSFGAQSMEPHVLASLGREHDPASVARCAELAGGAGFAGSYNVDLIFGAAGETVADWASSLGKVLALDPAAGARQRLRAHGRARDAAGRRAQPSPGRGRPGRQVHLGRRSPGGRRPAVVRDLQLGEARRRMRPQPPLLVPGGVLGDRLCGPLARRAARRLGAALVERTHA